MLRIAQQARLLGLVVVVATMVLSTTNTMANLGNLESIYEIKLVMGLVEYLRAEAIKDRDGILLASKYFVNERGVAYWGDLSLEGPTSDNNFQRIKALVEQGPNGDFVDANRLRHDPSNVNNDYAHIWRVIANDIRLAIDLKQLDNETMANAFLGQLKRCIFNRWETIIYARYHSILRIDRQEAIHLAVLKAHLDSFVLVRESLFEKLHKIIPDDTKCLPNLLQWDEIHRRNQLDHVRLEFCALRKYRSLRDRFLAELAKSQDWPSALIRVDEIANELVLVEANEDCRESVYTNFELGSTSPNLWLSRDDGSEIDQKHLVKLDNDCLIDEDGRVLKASTQPSEIRRLVWRSIYKAIKTLSVHIIASSEPNENFQSIGLIDDIFDILFNLKEAIIQRAIALNGMIDYEIRADSLENFYAHRDNLNEVFDQLGDELPSDKRDLYERLIARLNLVKEHDEVRNINKFRLKVDRESLGVRAKQSFIAVINHLTSLGDFLAGQPVNTTAQALKSVFEETFDCYEDEDTRNRLVQTLNEFKISLLEHFSLSGAEIRDSANDGIILSNVATDHGQHLATAASKQKELSELIRRVIIGLKEFKTTSAAYAIRAGDERVLKLMGDVFETVREITDLLDEKQELGSNENFEVLSNRVTRTIKMRDGYRINSRPLACHNRNSGSDIKRFNERTSLRRCRNNTSPIDWT